ncbi:hypothetical protein AB6E53_13360 [Vibrio breoganii]
MNPIVDFFESEDGLTVVEYVIGAALLAVIFSVVFVSVRQGLTDTLENTLDYVKIE